MFCNGKIWNLKDFNDHVFKLGLIWNSYPCIICPSTWSIFWIFILFLASFNLFFLYIHLNEDCHYISYRQYISYKCLQSNDFLLQLKFFAFVFLILLSISHLNHNVNFSYNSCIRRSYFYHKILIFFFIFWVFEIHHCLNLVFIKN
jgi:hypothetical protein